MSIYGKRVEPAYREISYGPEYWNNPHILKWWTPAHDDLIVEQIREHQWDWQGFINDPVLAITPTETIEAWKATDPLCREYAWYSILVHFAGARAQEIGLTQAIRKPQWKTCPMCGHDFVAK